MSELCQLAAILRPRSDREVPRGHTACCLGELFDGRRNAPSHEVRQEHGESQRDGGPQPDAASHVLARALDHAKGCGDTHDAGNLSIALKSRGCVLDGLMPIGSLFGPLPVRKRSLHLAVPERNVAPATSAPPGRIAEQQAVAAQRRSRAASAPCAMDSASRCQASGESATSVGADEASRARIRARTRRSTRADRASRSAMGAARYTSAAAMETATSTIETSSNFVRTLRLKSPPTRAKHARTRTA